MGVNMDTNEMILQYQQTKDVSLRNKIVMDNIKLVYHVAKKYRRKDEISSSVHDGVIGMIRAIESYDPNMGAAFSTYATYWISSKILKSTYRYLHIVKVGTTTPERLLLSDCRRMDDPSIADKYKQSVKRAFMDAVSLSGKSTADFYMEMQFPFVNGEPCAVDWRMGQRMVPTRECMGDSIADFRPSPESVAIKKDDLRVLRKILRSYSLNERERDIILFLKEGKNLSPLAQKYKVSRQRISQIKDRLLSRLKNELQLDGTI